MQTATTTTTATTVPRESVCFALPQPNADLLATCVALPEHVTLRALLSLLTCPQAVAFLEGVPSLKVKVSHPSDEKPKLLALLETYTVAAPACSFACEVGCRDRADDCTREVTGGHATKDACPRLAAVKRRATETWRKTFARKTAEEAEKMTAAAVIIQKAVRAFIKDPDDDLYN